ncbi:catalase [Roseateles amylovorans]|uniref:catalase n=1 Tax=Roseateles amylovorans TaxID=2978473 RepID=A0ABY6B6T9_9BURK|nr:catalase [Roseateles amylovorans]UXH80552.1 catalase [Roseateles amylovorans]
MANRKSDAPAPTGTSAKTAGAAAAPKTAKTGKTAPATEAPSNGAKAGKTAPSAKAAKAPGASVATAKPGASSVLGDGIGSALSTVAGPAQGEVTAPEGATEAQVRLVRKMAGTDTLARGTPSNPLKAAEHGRDNAVHPQAGVPVDAPDEEVGASTLSEDFASDKVGDGIPEAGENPTNDSLDRVRVDSTGRVLTTNQGVPVGDNQNSLKAGLRGPTLMEDFILREKITHFDHERIPERVVHARGSAAHGYFESYGALDDLTIAAPFEAAGKRTPVFVRFSTVAGERGSADTARDVRGFAVKFYTEQGNWDLVGNNMPVFFIQDAMKFPDLIHAVKPEPHNGMPQAASAHDTFWDFVSLMPESTHMLMWVMSDRAIPRSYRMMQGFGVHTFRLVNAQGEAHFVKFHWTPRAGTHSLVWDEAVKLAGADPDFHRRDLWEAIEAGQYPEWELGLQVFTEEQSEQWSFDILDPTKIVPEELVPIRPVGRMVLTRNPDNFFAETEQVAFCTAHIIPGIDFSNDPLLAGRIHSYLDTQITRLGGANFHEIPINAPIAQVHNNQRDGLHRQAIPRGRVAYEPNSLAGGCPFQAGKSGFVSYPKAIQGEALRGKPERFAEHYAQATLFWQSQSEAEQDHIVGAFRFELTRVQTPAIRQRVLAMLRHVDETLATRLADDLGMDLPAPLPDLLGDSGVGAPVAGAVQPPEVTRSDSLSLLDRPGDGGLWGRRVALLVHEGIDGARVREVHEAVLSAGGVPRYIGHRLGDVSTAEGDVIPVEITLETAPGALWDAVVLPEETDDAPHLSRSAQAVAFVQDQYLHCKPLLVLGHDSALLAAVGAPGSVDEADGDPALFFMDPPATPEDGTDLATVTAFLTSLAGHRRFEREMDPPQR